ncbi:MAG: haloacid dehalogenase type II [Haloferacaceae archaeon]
MSLDTDRVETVTVDSYGTLVDPRAADRALAERVDEPEPISRLWRSRSLTYTMVGNVVGFYQPFYEMNRDALEFALAAHGVDLPSEEVDEVLSVYLDLDAFEDVRPGIERLRAAGYDVWVVSNGDPRMLDAMVDHAGLEGVVAGTVSADEVQTFKPHPRIYRHAAARTGTPVRRLLHAAGPAFDVLGAKHAGAQAAWVDRYDEPWESFAGVDPDATVAGFHDLADALGV